jgi:putative hydrolase
MGLYLHGKGQILDNVRAAAEKGLSELGITDHGPWDFYGMSISRIADMRNDIANAVKEFPLVSVYLGVEADIVDSPNGIDITPDEFGKFDYVNAGYHYVPNSNMAENFTSFRLRAASKSQIEKLRQQNADRIIKALTSNNIKILTHPGDKAYIDEEAVAKVCAETDTLVEINARHRHPNAEDLKIYAAHDVKFVISSDAHSPDKVGRYAKSLALAFAAGIDVSRIVNIEER